MKKTTIALLTAAAMGTSGAVMAADHGPTVSGRVDMSIVNLSGEETSFGDRSTVVGVGGSTDLVGGLTGSYFVRGNYTVTGNEDNDDAETNVNADYASFTVSGDFGSLSFGRADNVVYNFAGAHTDVYRSLGTTASSTYGEAGFQPGEAIEYYGTFDMLTIGGYVDTAEGDGIENVQLGGLVDFGIGNASLIYAEDDASGGSEVVFGAFVDFDVVSIGGSYTDSFDGSNPFAVAAIVPLDDMFNVIVGYGDNDDGIEDYNVSVVADLGGGLDARVEYRGGDSQDGVALNARYSF